MKKKGFTLIELLAVIVILAIIALIAVPIILNIISNSKKSAVLRSGELYLKAAETAIARENLKNQFNPTTCIIGIDGNLTCDEDKKLTIEVDGSKPTSGTITFEKGKIIRVDKMILDGFELEKTTTEKLKIAGNSTQKPENPTVELNPQGTYLMKATSVNSADTTFLGGTINRSIVETITVTYTNKVPSNVIGSWDASEAQDKSIMAWYTDTDNNNLYELYIGGEGGVKANPNSSYLFRYFSNVITMDLKYLDTSKVTTMNGMFYRCSSLTTLNLNSFDTSKVTTMKDMFYYCIGLEDLNLDKLDTSNVTTMNGMFSCCSSLTSLDIINFDTSQVTNMGGMFSGCSNLTSIDVNSLDTSKVTNMSSMFSGCSSLTNLDVTNFDTSKVTNMTAMFQNCSSLTNLDVTNFDTSQVTDMSYMFCYCKSLISLNLVNFNTSKVTTMASMFSICKSLTNVNMKNAIFDSVTKYTSMFESTSKLTTITVKDIVAQTFINARLTDASKTGVTVTIA